MNPFLRVLGIQLPSVLVCTGTWLWSTSAGLLSETISTGSVNIHCWEHLASFRFQPTTAKAPQKLGFGWHRNAGVPGAGLDDGGLVLAQVLPSWDD